MDHLATAADRATTSRPTARSRPSAGTRSRGGTRHAFRPPEISTALPADLDQQLTGKPMITLRPRPHYRRATSGPDGAPTHARPPTDLKHTSPARTIKYSTCSAVPTPTQTPTGPTDHHRSPRLPAQPRPQDLKRDHKITVDERKTPDKIAHEIRRRLEPNHRRPR
jgi:hypothetical protein